jgi:branched-chain amino acid transport system permease protein
MLVATFAIAFLLQSIAVLAFGQLGTVASSIGPLNQPWDIGGVLIRKIAIVSIAIAAVCLVLLQLLLTRTSIGLHMRAAAMDFRTSRMLGVRANRVVGGAVLISGLFAAVSAIMLTGRNPQVTPIFGTRPIAATLGGFTIGFASGILGGALPTNQSQYLPSFLFGAVIIVLLLRPSGLFTRGDVAMERL